MRHGARAGAAIAMAIGTTIAASFGAASLASAPQASAPQASAHRASSTPAWTYSIGTNVEFSSPAFGMDGSTPIIAVGSYSGEVYVVNADTGKAMPGWPQVAAMYPGEKGTAIESSPAIANLDGPGKPPSIIVGTGSLSVPDQNGGVIAWNMNGSIRFRFHTHHKVQPGQTQYDAYVFGTPAVGSITGKGSEDIAFGSYDRYMYIINNKGKNLPGSPIFREDTIWSSAALADPTGTGYDDVLMGGDATGGRFYGCIGGWIVNYGWSVKHQKIVRWWQHCEGQSIWSSPAVGYLSTSSKQLALVVGASWNSAYASNPATDKLFAYYVKSGKPVPGWPARAAGATFGSPAIVTLVPGHQPVVVESDCAHCGKAFVQEWQGNGKLQWTNEISDKYEVLGSPVVANVTGGEIQDILVGLTTGLQVLEGDNGKSVETIDSRCRMADSPAVFDLGKDTTNFPSGWGVVVACDYHGANLHAFAIPAPTNLPQWPQWRDNAAKTGYPGTS